MYLDPYLTPYTKNNMKWIIDLNVRAKIVKILEKIIGVNFCDLGNYSLGMTPKA